LRQLLWRGLGVEPPLDDVSTKQRHDATPAPRPAARRKGHDAARRRGGKR
jgi:hypothetical protein